MNNPRRILVFGSSGVGKTSMLNAVAAVFSSSFQEHKTNNGAVGCTFKIEMFSSIPVKGIDYEFIDIVGLNETEIDTVPGSYALTILIDFLKSNKQGFNLLIFVVRIGRITETTMDNYNLFVRNLTVGKVPVICVVTGCENEDPMSAWGERNASSFQKNEMNFKAIVCSCFAKSGRMDLENIFRDLRTESVHSVMNAIDKHSLQQPISLYSNSSDLWIMVKNMWNNFCRFVKQNSWLWINGTVKNLLIRLGLEEGEAVKVAANPDFL